MSVIIVGGGVVGISFALALSHLTNGKIPIDIIELKPFDNTQPYGLDTRVLALSLGSRQKLQQVGVWDCFEQYAEAIKSIHVTDAGHVGQVSLESEEYDLPAFGYVTALNEITDDLLIKLNNVPNITLHCPDKIVDIVQEQEQITVMLQSGSTLSGRLLVAADGAGSLTAQKVNIEFKQRKYNQIGIIANIEISHPKNGVAFEQFTPNGPFALLPMTRNRYSLVWCLPAIEQQKVMEWSDAEFQQALQEQMGDRLGCVQRIGKRVCYPLNLQYANQHISHRIALIGNAAQAIHPIAGQGFNLGVRDLVQLAAIIQQADEQGKDIGGYETLYRYQKMRLPDQKKIIWATENLLKLFINQSFLLKGVRNLAMLTMNHCSLLSRSLVEIALGDYRS